MHITNDNRLKKLIVIGDRLLIKLTRPDERTASGLYLPPGVQEKEKVQQGYVIKTGPGYAIPMPVENESWKGEEDQVKYEIFHCATKCNINARAGRRAVSRIMNIISCNFQSKFSYGSEYKIFADY